ncbi:hypothetical protein GCM10028792_33860 [Salinisphaera aquimarina]
MDEIRSAEIVIRRGLAAFLDEHLKEAVPPGVEPPKPKFLRQGSNAYGTLIDPLRWSANYGEADSDVGMYLPLEFLQAGTPTPKLGAEALRQLTCAALKDIAARNDWSFESKQCCDRVIIRSDAYIDVTSYAIPVAQHRAMAALNFREGLVKAESITAAENEISWEEIPHTSLLATKDGWVRSDAKAVHQKVENTSLLRGPLFKRVVRFGKALRDLNDDEDGPNSITYTLLVADKLDAGLCRLGRDDLAMLSVLGPVADGLFDSLPTPGNEDIDILEGVDLQVRHRLAKTLRDRQASIRQALDHSSIDQAHQILKGVFGSRFPDAPELPAESNSKISLATSSAAPAVVTAPRTKSVPLRGNAHSS